MRHRITVLPTFPRSDLVALFVSSDIFVFPSHSEGASLALLEAMAGGLPIVTTPVGAAPDLLRDGESALFVGAGDAFALQNASKDWSTTRRQERASVEMRKLRRAD